MKISIKIQESSRKKLEEREATLRVDADGEYLDLGSYEIEGEILPQEKNINDCVRRWLHNGENKENLSDECKAVIVYYEKLVSKEIEDESDKQMFKKIKQAIEKEKKALADKKAFPVSEQKKRVASDEDKDRALRLWCNANDELRAAFVEDLERLGREKNNPQLATALINHIKQNKDKCKKSDAPAQTAHPEKTTPKAEPARGIKDADRPKRKRVKEIEILPQLEGKNLMTYTPFKYQIYDTSGRPAGKGAYVNMGVGFYNKDGKAYVMIDEGNRMLGYPIAPMSFPYNQAKGVKIQNAQVAQATGRISVTGKLLGIESKLDLVIDERLLKSILKEILRRQMWNDPPGIPDSDGKMHAFTIGGGSHVIDKKPSIQKPEPTGVDESKSVKNRLQKIILEETQNLLKEKTQNERE